MLRFRQTPPDLETINFNETRGFPISCSKIGFKINALQEIILIK